MRAKFVARLLVAVAIVVPSVYLIFLSVQNTDTKEAVRYTTTTKRQSQLIQKAVFLRYGDTDAITIFSAYRHADGVNVILASYGYYMRQLHCRLFDADLKEILPSAEALVFPEFTVHCPASNKAKFVALTLNDDDHVDQRDMHQIDTANDDSRSFFSVCLAPLWGDSPKWLMLAEFVEYYRLQGVEKFYVYKQNADNLTEALLEDYVSNGVVEVVDVPDTTNCLKRHRCRHEVQLQDCVYRLRGRTEWVATVDLDERIFISNGTSIKDYIGSITSEEIGELRFRCRWVLRMRETAVNPAEWRLYGSPIPMAEWHNTSHVAPLNHTTKSIVRPTKVESMGVHQVIRFSPGASVLLVSPEDAVVRHYRNVAGWTFFLKEAETFGSFELTNIASNLLETLQNRVDKLISRLFE
ncbi:hypothetical protein Q1695_011706 [Nippostrongylus brasiliensis]|nr:hypothetical protein Q1695_011706 [Nippostrongylus brasiliensis]